MKQLDDELSEKISQLKTKNDEVAKLQKLIGKQKVRVWASYHILFNVILQEEKISYENKLKQMDGELVKKNSELKIKNGKVTELQGERQKLAEMLKVIIVHKESDLHNLHFIGREICIWIKA